MPFYAGWGLTNDLLPAPARRTRRLRLEELVAGSLILYPLYVSATTGRPTTPERVVQQIAEGAALKASGAMEALLAGLNPAGAFCRRVAGRLFFSLASHRSI
jgi:capsule polysaccharide export protein KpsC/LpsZ